MVTKSKSKRDLSNAEIAVNIINNLDSTIQQVLTLRKQLCKGIKEQLRNEMDVTTRSKKYIEALRTSKECKILDDFISGLHGLTVLKQQVLAAKEYLIAKGMSSYTSNVLSYEEPNELIGEADSANINAA